MSSVNSVLRDPTMTPRPGDRFRCSDGTELEVVRVVIAAWEGGKQARCLFAYRFADGRGMQLPVSLPHFRRRVQGAALLARGDDEDPWPNAERRTYVQVFGWERGQWGSPAVGPSAS